MTEFALEHLQSTSTPASRPVELASALAVRRDFKSFAQDLSESVLFALERRHLEYLDLRHVPAPQLIHAPAPGDLFFMRLAQIGHGAAMDRSLDVLNVQNILGAFRDGSHSLAVALGTQGAESRIYFGARRMPGRGGGQTTFDFVQQLQRSFEGNLPGSRFHSFPGEEGPSCLCPPDEVYRHVTEPLERFPYLAALTGIPSLRAERGDQFAQSMDRFIQSMQGQRYLLLILAEPLPDAQTSELLANSLRLGTEIHSWVRLTSSYAQAVSDAVARARSEGTVHNEAEAQSVAHSVGKGSGKQPGAVIGGVLGAGLALAAAPLIGPAALGITGVTSYLGGALGGSVSDNVNDTDSTSRTKSWGDSVTESLTSTSTRTETGTLTQEYLNRTAEYCEQSVSRFVHRLRGGKSLGMWNVGLYFLAEDPSTFAQGCAQLRALYSGSESHFEPMRALDLSQPGVRYHLGAVLSSYSNPVLELEDRGTGEPLPHPLGKLFRGLSTPLHTEELALMLNLPRREVPGLRLEFVADFGVNPRPADPRLATTIGHVVSGGRPLQDLPYALMPSDLNRHVFVTGITGSGKTNTCFALLMAAAGRGVPFMVIEPAKGEYRTLLGDPTLPGLHVYTLGDETVSPFRINPFQFVPGTNLITHLDHLKAIFNASFPMYAAMPYLLEEALVEVYQDRGWDLVTSTNRQFDMPALAARWAEGDHDYRYTAYLPRLGDLFAKIDEVVRSKGYAEEVTSNYAAALKARLHSLVLGAKGRMLDTQTGIPYASLFDSPVVLELRGLGDDDEKAFLMALLLTQLYEYREQTHRTRPTEGLRHLCVIEEAHRLLGKAGPVGGESANPRGKAVESFANMLAEIREYGQGLLIVDQSPAKLVGDVVKNTSTKILHRLTAPDDRREVGEAMGLTEDQRRMVPQLRVGHAVISAEEQDKPVWAQMLPAKVNRARVSDAALRERMAPAMRARSARELAAATAGGRALGSRSSGLLKRLRDPG